MVVELIQTVRGSQTPPSGNLAVGHQCHSGYSCDQAQMDSHTASLLYCNHPNFLWTSTA